MHALLDTHVWIWLLEDPTRIAPEVLQQLEAAETLTFSVASLWEIAIKTEPGKLAMTTTPEVVREEILREARASELPIRAVHALGAARLPRLHKVLLTACSSHRPEQRTSSW
jgi:PIN domain nuclease of toxin-antitoxin system